MSEAEQTLEDHNAKMEASMQKLFECIGDLNLPAASVVDLMTIALAEVIARSSNDRESANHVIAFVGNRINELIDAFENAKLPEWTRKADS